MTTLLAIGFIVGFFGILFTILGANIESLPTTVLGIFLNGMCAGIVLSSLLI